MKTTFTKVGNIFALSAIFYLISCSNNSGTDTEKKNSPQSPAVQKNQEKTENSYKKLRDIALKVSPAQLGLTVSINKMEVYGVIMDWEMAGAFITTASFITGDASVYKSTGGIVIGGIQNPGVSAAAKQLVTLAQIYIDKAVKTETTPLPAKDHVAFYLLTNKGVFTAQEGLTNFENNASQWLGLFEEVNKVLTELRKTTGK